MHACSHLQRVFKLYDSSSTSPGSGSGYVLKIQTLNQFSTESPFPISYPLSPTIVKVTGCTDSGNRTINCLTTGGNTLTVFGTNFCDFGPSGTCSVSVQIGLSKCSPTYISSTQFTCPLPAATGVDLAIVIVEARPGGVTYSSPGVSLVSYARASITSVSG